MPKMPPLTRVALVACGLALLAPMAIADDVDLISRGQQDPYVFFLFDVSGSMNWSIPCTPQEAADGLCSYICSEGFCEPPLVADDPDNRMFVAKEALFGLMEETQGVNFGFATFDQDSVHVDWKHWWYAVGDDTLNPGYTGVTLSTVAGVPATVILAPGEEHIFGQVHNCNPGSGGNPARQIGCNADNPARLERAYDEERVRRYAKLDDDNDTYREYYLRDPVDGRKYRVRWRTVAGPNIPGDPTITANVDVERCTSNDCGSWINLYRSDLVFEKRSEFMRWDWDPPGNVPAHPEHGYMFDIQHIDQSGQELAWDPNTDDGADDWRGYNLKYFPNIPDPLGRGAAFAIGDVIPWDWEDDHRETIKQRMAPNTLVNPMDPPDFGVARYFQDHRIGGEDFLRLKTEFYDPLNPLTPQAKPLVPSGGTPTGGSMASFRAWLRDWLPVADDPVNGDADINCKTLNLVVVTDGQATDGGVACTEANRLFNLSVGGDTYHIRSFALALGDKDLASGGFTNVLTCIADNGGSSSDPSIDRWPPGAPDGEVDGPGPLFAKNKEELIKQLASILDVIGGTNKSFAAAAVQRAQANADEKIVLSSFVPDPLQNVWPGRVDAFLKPVPTREVVIDGVVRRIPDRTQRCSGADPSGCLAWDAGESLLAQTPDDTDITAGDYKLGVGADERRVFYTTPNVVGVPDSRLMLDTPATDPEWENLTAALGICLPGDLLCAANAGSRTEATGVLDFLYEVKQFEDPETGDPTDFILGEVFHSVPLIIGSPDNFRAFSQNRNDYRDFFSEHRFRRKVLAVNSNDGQLHVFEAGIFRGDVDTGEFDVGTGHEVFAFTPRDSMPKLTDMADPSQQPEHRYLNDGSAINADVYIDPDHNGTPDPNDREWRTVLVWGQREGGRSVMAIDMTQPDVTDADAIPIPGAGDWVPSCVDGGTSCGTLPYPSVLWEFRDTVNCPGLTVGDNLNDPDFLPGGLLHDPYLHPRCDEDLDLLPDLGFTWSTPVLGSIRVCSSAPCNLDPDTGNVEERFVAIFAGGMDPEHKTEAQQSGNYLYMIDIETGEPLYKRKVGEGAAPAEPAVIDSDQDGFLDTIYVGTYKGLMYKVDIRDPRPIVDLGASGKKVTDADWNPFAIFTSGGKPLPFPPAVVFIPERVQFALAFGTGDREDLWSELPNDEGRFYVFVDDDFEPTSPGLPFDENDLRSITVTSGDQPAGTNFLLDDPPAGDIPGFFFPLLDGERIITPAFALGGITVFSTFEPRIEEVQNATCAARGDSRVYVIFTTNGDAVADQRFEVIKSLLSETFVDTGNVGKDDEGGGDPNDPPVDDDDSCGDSDRARQIVEELMLLFPKNCRFTSKTICLKAVGDSTEVLPQAPVPVCTMIRNWKEL